MSTHFIIPDIQAKPGLTYEHLTAAANYCVAKQPDTIIQIGDWADFPSLSIYDSIGSKKTEGQRYSEDVKAANESLEAFEGVIKEYNKKRKKNKERQYKPRKVLTLGNHEHRVLRAIEQNPRHFEGVISLDDLNFEREGWETYPYQEIVEIDGILYSHNFVNQGSLKKTIIGGTIQNKLHKIGQSFVMGHQQVRQIGDITFANGKIARGIVWGAFYQHDEDYMGIQGNYYPRGCVMLHEVVDGDYNLMELSLDYLIKNWY